MYFRRQLRVMGIFLPRLSEESEYTANKNDNIGTIQYYRILRMHKSQRSLAILMGKQPQVFWGSVYSSLWNNVSFLINSFFFKIGMFFVVFSKLQTLPNFFGIYHTGSIYNCHVMGPKGKKKSNLPESLWFSGTSIVILLQY